MYGVEKITVNEDITLVTFYNIPSRLNVVADILQNVADAGIIIDMISYTASMSENVNLSFTVFSDELVKVLSLVNKFREEHGSIKVMVNGGNSKIQLFGKDMNKMSGVASRAFTAAAKVETEAMLITTSEVDISLLTTDHACGEIVSHLEKAFEVKAEYIK